ncbi:DUF1318 domain-containing protein [Pelobacter propionicus]|uniref:Lipoprotein, putative n=1 Tax=Pelobacter propionicus (strain DSM 2379 / NBRC 103807 / OttBd1) TaxID=338966 RepID=A1AQ00_PELPD|nr:DUF1318 domain-containing protein [Pelobacter propionicus]ABK99420.1 lipoprotein, putative [Pelobacter propionicus DSM 2379]
MKSRLFKWLLAGLCTFLAACAIITVNVYFPEKAVKEAYKSLDDMLLKENGTQPATEKQPGAEAVQPEAKPQSGLFNELPSLGLCATAHAADNVGDELAVEMAGMPEVVKAYDAMSKRQSKISSLFDSAAVGLSSQGLVVARDKSKLTPADEALISQENQDRKTVISSMAKSILKLNKTEESKAALNQVMGKAAATYAETRREAAKAGWWMQLQNGRWLQK